MTTEATNYTTCNFFNPEVDIQGQLVRKRVISFSTKIRNCAINNQIHQMLPYTEDTKSYRATVVGVTSSIVTEAML